MKLSVAFSMWVDSIVGVADRLIFKIIIALFWVQAFYSNNKKASAGVFEF